MANFILEKRGYFWWHEKPVAEHQFAPNMSVTGKLTITEEGRIKLELDGVLSKDGVPQIFGQKSLEKNQHIQGIFSDTKEYVLLLEPHSNGGQIGVVSYEPFYATSCLIGYSQFPHGKKLHSKKLTVDLRGYEAWLRLGTTEVKQTRTGISAKYLKPKSISYPQADGKISITSSCNANKEWRSPDLSFKQTTSLTYNYTKAIVLEKAQAEFRLIEELLTLLTNSEYRLDWPQISFAGRQCTYYFSRGSRLAKAPEWHECWTNFPKLRDDFGQLFANWKAKREDFGAGFNLYFATRRGMSLYLEHRFASLMWGIESFHREKHPSKTLPKVFTDQEKRILNNIQDKSDKDWLARQLSGNKEAKLAKKVFDAFNVIPLALDEIKLREFSNRCAIRRNDISHYGGSREKEKSDSFSEELIKLTDALSYLYHFLLLHEIGVSEEIIKWWFHQGFETSKIKSTLAQAGLMEHRRPALPKPHG